MIIASGENKSSKKAQFGKFHLESGERSNLVVLVGIFVVIAAFGAIPRAPNAASAATVATSPSLSPTAQGLTKGLVGYWTFDGKDMANGVALDKSGNGNNGNPINISTSTFYTAGKIGQALKFDAVNDYVNVGDPADGDLDFDVNNFSVSFWVYRLPNTTTNLRALSKGATTDVVGEAGYAFFASNTSVTLIINFSAARVLVAGTYTPNAWHHIVGTVNRGENMRIYVDSVLQNTTDISAQAGSVSGTKSFQVGGRDNGLSPWSGKVDDVRVYNRQLSQGEVKQLYKLGAEKFDVSPAPAAGAGLGRGLVGYWTFDGKDMANGVARDVSGNFATGSPINIATSTFYVPGKIGQGLKFDGVNDYIGAGDVDAIDTATKLSACVWAFPVNPPSIAYMIAKSVSGANVDGIFFRREASANVSGRANEYSIVVHDSADTDNARVEGAAQSAPANQWRHICFTYVALSATGLHLYINGVEDANSPVSTASIGAINAGTNPLRFGSRSDIVSQLFSGKLDDVRVYSRALSAGEIKQLYNLGAEKFAVSPPLASTGQGLTNGLVGYWTFDGKDMANGVARDASGNFATGTPINIATSTFYVPGKVGQALNFDGVDDAVNAGDPASGALDFTANQNYTYSIWFKSKTSILTTLGGKGFTANGPGYGSRVDTQAKCWLGNGTTAVESAGGTISVGKWNNIICTKSGTTLTTYLNGVSVNSSTNAIVDDDISNANLFCIGARGTTVCNTNFFNGTLDDVRIYNRALSAQEIKQLYNLGR